MRFLSLVATVYVVVFMAAVLLAAAIAAGAYLASQ
jgi:hypothetical protein